MSGGQFVAALDLLLERMKAAGVALGEVRSVVVFVPGGCSHPHRPGNRQIVAISGSGQQHGSVYWKSGARQVLQKLQAAQTLEAQLTGACGDVLA